ncbi:hypothetical protein NSP_49550 [Nodularia spumigena CCY9414]|nr:hypothetical protein NSP_49550 [Nodularia spumigena CCY9414]
MQHQSLSHLPYMSFGMPDSLLYLQDLPFLGVDQQIIIT